MENNLMVLCYGGLQTLKYLFCLVRGHLCTIQASCLLFSKALWYLRLEEEVSMSLSSIVRIALRVLFYEECLNKRGLVGDNRIDAWRANYPSEDQ